jgi:CRP/FNR family transcriptional regulator, anaerobic regulatory protein
VIPFRARTQSRCTDCRVDGGCLRANFPPQSLSLLHDLEFTRRRVMQGHALFMEGDPVRFLYAVRQGSFKSVLMLPDGRDQVARFPMPGDLLGLDGMGRGAYASTVIALEDSEVCALPIQGVHRQLNHAAWREAMCRLMGQEIVRVSRHMLLLGSAGTDARVAMFLLELSDAMRARGYSPTEFHMRMTRAEIGSYVGLTLETVSRTLSSFQQRGWICVHKRHITILALAALRTASEPGHHG